MGRPICFALTKAQSMPVPVKGNWYVFFLLSTTCTARLYRIESGGLNVTEIVQVC